MVWLFGGLLLYNILYIIGHVHKLWFIGSSLDDLKKFPLEARKESGFQLRMIQEGEQPIDYKPMKTIGLGVQEIRIKCKSGAFRVIYYTKIKGAVYVLHAFQKKTAKTGRQDIDLAKKRFKELMKCR